MSESIVLKPCPFCGSQPRMIIRQACYGFQNRYSVLCDYDTGGCGSESGWYHDDKTAAECWNNRVDKEWIPVTTALPAIDEDVLVYAVAKDPWHVPDTVTIISALTDANPITLRKGSTPYWKLPQYFLSSFKLTHWMKLPSDPEEE